MDKIQELEERIIELEAQNELLKSALSHIATAISPEFNTFGLYAFVSGFTAKEIKELEGFFKWAFLEANDLTKEKLIEEYNKRLPKKKDMLEGIMKAYKADGMFEPIWKIVLGT